MTYVPYGLLSVQAAAKGCSGSIDLLQLHTLTGQVFSSSDELVRGVADLVRGERYTAVGLSTMCSSFHHSIGLVRS